MGEKCDGKGLVRRGRGSHRTQQTCIPPARPIVRGCGAAVPPWTPGRCGRLLVAQPGNIQIP
jgi:hypothetical protein